MEPKLFKDDALTAIRGGAVMLFVWAGSSDLPTNPCLLSPSGRMHALDGRCYKALRDDKRLIRRERGSTEQGNLVIEWHWKPVTPAQP